MRLTPAILARIKISQVDYKARALGQKNGDAPVTAQAY